MKIWILGKFQKPKGKAGTQKIEGIAAGFIPEALNTKIDDEIIKDPKEAAFEKVKLLLTKEGISAGISSGSALQTAIELTKLLENSGKTIDALLSYFGLTYYSTPLFTD